MRVFSAVSGEGCEASEREREKEAKMREKEKRIVQDNASFCSIFVVIILWWWWLLLVSVRFVWSVNRIGSGGGGDWLYTKNYGHFAFVCCR